MTCFRRLRNLISDGEKIEKLPHLHAVVHAEIVGHVADYAPHAQGIAGYAVARDHAIAAGSLKQRGQKADGGAFAGAIGADKSKQLPCSDSQIQGFDGGELAVLFGEVDKFDHGRVQDAGFRVQRSHSRI